MRVLESKNRRNTEKEIIKNNPRKISPDLRDMSFQFVFRVRILTPT